MDITTQTHTSAAVSVKIEADPNNDVHTSPDTLEDAPNICISKYPIPRAPTESIAIAASPLIFAFLPVQNGKQYRNRHDNKHTVGNPQH